MEVAGDPDDFMPVYSSLSKNEPLVKAVREVVSHLRSDRIVGKRLIRKQIPQYYLKKHDVNAVFKVDLPGYWRLIYGVVEIHGEKKALIMEIFDHKRYNKRFGY